MFRYKYIYLYFYIPIDIYVSELNVYRPRHVLNVLNYFIKDLTLTTYDIFKHPCEFELIIQRCTLSGFSSFFILPIHYNIITSFITLSL